MHDTDKPPPSPVDIVVGSPDVELNHASNEKSTEAVPSPREEAPSSPGSVLGISEHEERDADPEAAVSSATEGPAYSVFSKGTKRWIIAMVAVSSFFSPMTANIYFPALNTIATDLNVSISLINLTLTTYMILQGIAPTLLGDFGDMAGRRPAFLVAFTIYLIANLGLALQDNFAALLVLRMLQSAGSSGTLALGFAVVADVAPSAERGKYMGYIGAGINIGPAISPVLGGVLAEYLGWRAIFWFCLILTVVWLIPYVISVPETCRRVVGNGSIPPQGWNMTLVDYVRFRRQPKADRPAVTQTRLRFPNPLRTVQVVFRKEMSLLLFFNTLLFLTLIITVATLSPIFADTYGLNNLQIGLCFLPYGAGCCLSAVAQGHLLDWNYARTTRRIGFRIDARRGDDLAGFPIERARLQPLMPLLACGLAANVGYAWALQRAAPLAVPLALHFFVGLCLAGGFSVVQTLIVDLNPQAPATAVAAVNLVRCLVGSAVVAFIEQMLAALGRGWCFTFWALLCAAAAPVLLVVQRRGPAWREANRVRALEALKARDEMLESSRQVKA